MISTPYATAVRRWPAPCTLLDAMKRQDPTTSTLRLAQGISLYWAQADSLVLGDGTANVHLNDSAAAILQLCDGTRTRAAIVAHMVGHSSDTQLQLDINEFLDAAEGRGWIVRKQGRRSSTRGKS